jgi:uncharacterized damage-inducible protein DinB
MNENYLNDIIKRFEYYKLLGDQAMAQLNDEELKVELGEESGSIAMIVKHISGNMLSRWTDFLTTDGEKPWRNRDTEFIDNLEGSTINETWEKGWECLFTTMKGLSAEDMERTIYIRAQPLTVVEAINRQLAHVPYHVGQIVFIAKAIRGTAWESLSIPKGKSEEFNAKLFGKKS